MQWGALGVAMAAGFDAALLLLLPAMLHFKRIVWLMLLLFCCCKKVGPNNYSLMSEWFFVAAFILPW